MPIVTNTNPRMVSLAPELAEILARNGMQAHVVAASNGYLLMVQGHDSPMLQYAITDNQLKALIGWGTNSSNKKAYNTFASIVAADFDIPKDFTHARNANGRVAMGLHGYRIGVGEYGRVHHLHGTQFLGWAPRMQDGYHLRRIGGQLYFPGAPTVAQRIDGRMKPGELQSGGYGFYYKQNATAQTAQLDVVQELQSVLPMQRSRATEAKPYNELITSDVYFTNEKWQEILSSHGLIVDADNKKLLVQSSAVNADLLYDLTDTEVKALTANSLKEASVDKRIETINSVIGADFAQKVTAEMLDSKELISIQLHPEVQQDLTNQISIKSQQYTAINNQESSNQIIASNGTVVMDGNDLANINPDKGWYREGKHGREVTVNNITVEPAETDGKYKMTAVIDGEVISHEITQKQYDKFMAIDDYHRFQLFSKIFKEVDLKDRNPVNFGTKLSAALFAGVVVAHDIMHGPRQVPEIYGENHGRAPQVYAKPGVDTPADVAARSFDAIVNNPDKRPIQGIGL